MQLLWSRAVQIRSSCRCISCVRSATATARRATSAAVRGRLKFGDVFTVCYSSILASAALADAKAKDNRRKEWDRVIAEARAGKSIRSPDGVHVEQALSDMGSSGVVSSTYCETDSRSCEFNAIWNPSHWLPSQAMSLESPFVQIEGQLRDLAAQNTEIFMQQGATCAYRPKPYLDDKWVDEPAMRGVPFREAKSTLQLQNVNSVIGKLVGQLLLKTTVFTSFSFEEASRTPSLTEDIRDMARRLELLQYGFNQVPSYSQQDPRTVKERRFELHNIIRSACRSLSADRFKSDLIVAKICYNLLVSTAPPSIVTYNILIHELNKLGEHEMAQVVIDSFFNDSRFAPTSKTVCLLLDHYVAKGDKTGFQSVIQRMRGVINDMHIKKRKLEFLRDSPVLDWALNNKVIHRSGRLIGKVPRDSDIFDSLIHGSLRLLGATAANRYLRAALRECQEIREETLCDVVNSCLAKPDYNSAELLLQAIFSWWRDDNGHALFRFTKKVRAALHQLLRVCGIDSLPISNQAVGQSIIQRNFHGLLLHMQLESLAEKIERHAQCIASLRSALHMDTLPSQTIGSEDVDRALHILALRNRSEYNRKRFQKWHEKYAKRIKHRVAEVKQINPEALVPRSAVLRQLVASNPIQSVDHKMEDGRCISHSIADEALSTKEQSPTSLDGAVASLAKVIMQSNHPFETNPPFENESLSREIPTLSSSPSRVPHTTVSPHVGIVRYSNRMTKGSQLGNLHVSRRICEANTSELRLAYYN